MLLDFIEDFSCNNSKNLCNAWRLDDMHASLPGLKYRSLLYDVPSLKGVFVCYPKPYLFIFIDLTHLRACLPLKYKCNAHPRLFVMITALIVSQAWPCFQVWCCLIYHERASQVIHLLDSLSNCSLINYMCPANTHQAWVVHDDYCSCCLSSLTLPPSVVLLDSSWRSLTSHSCPGFPR